MKNKKNSKKTKKDFVSNEVVYRICGIPVFSKTVSINEDELYKKMASKFEIAMTKALDKKIQG